MKITIKALNNSFISRYAKRLVSNKISTSSFRIYPAVLLIFFVSFSISVPAQEKKTINKNVKVVKAYSPSLSDASKVNRMPVLKDSVGVKSEFKYSIQSKAVITSNDIEPITPARLGKGRKEPLKSSYFRAGFGNYNSFFGDLNYNILQSEPFVLGLNVGHWSSFGNVTLEDGERVDAPFHDTWGKVGFDYLLRNKTFYTRIDFNHNIYNYYGYHTVDPDSTYLAPGYVNPVQGNTLIPDAKQRLAGVDVIVGFKNNVVRDDRIIYDMTLGYRSFGNKTGVSQNGFDIGGSAYFPLGTIGLAIDLDIRYNSTLTPDLTGPLYHFHDRKNTLIGFSPKVVFNFEKAKVNVGLLLYGELDTFDDQFQIAPILTGELTIVEGVVSIEGGLKGHYNQNDYRTVQYENPFVSPDRNVKTSFYGIDLFAAVKGNFSKSMSFGLDFSYAMFMNEHFYINRFFLENRGADSRFDYTNLFAPIYDDGSVLTFTGELLYHPSEKLRLLAKGTYYGWKTDSLSKAWNKPDMELVFNGKFSPVKDLWVDAGINILGKRYAFDPYAWAEKKLKPVYDLNIGAEYYYNSTWSFFARVNNLAASKYYMWNGYPAQGINVHVGIGISF